MSRPAVRPAVRWRDDGGALLVEAALVVPLVLSLFMGMFDFGLLEFRQSQLSSAARDGARVGIIDWVDADTATYSGGNCPDTPGSFDAICTGVLQRLVGLKITGVVARCYVGSSATGEPCSPDVVTPGLDSLVVTVSMDYQPATPIGQTFIGVSRSFSASTRMVIQ